MTLDESRDLIEEGAASIHLADRSRRAEPKRETLDVIVIGGGQAGLSVGYHLAQAGARFAILDENPRVGDGWRKRWDSLRLFTPAKFDGLDGMRFPAPGNYFPTKDEMADYLEAYARRFQLPVRNSVRVERLFKRGSRYVARAAELAFEAPYVVVAMAKYQRPKVPAFAATLSRDITQLHSQHYRNLSQLRPGGVLLVGGGNSGADIAMETARAGHKSWMAGRDTGQVPFRPESFWGRNVMGPLVIGFVFHHVLTVRTPLGRKARRGALSNAVPRIRVKASDLAAAGVERVPRMVGVRDGRPLLEDGRTLDVANVIWCTGFHPGFDWIDLPVFDEKGEINHESGIVEEQPGLYFVGLPFLHAMSSSMIHGVGRDAARIAGVITSRLKAYADA
ncbi:MAG TPA: FAD-dependent oxidoreductase [Vicinamibacterales bacterium]|nr:FAD-dependent oxidoreductase [Vicinamibacterales bacterium]